MKSGTLTYILFILFGSSFVGASLGIVAISVFYDITLLMIPLICVMLALLSSILLLMSYLGFAQACNNLSIKALRTAKDANKNLNVALGYWRQAQKLSRDLLSAENPDEVRRALEWLFA